VGHIQPNREEFLFPLEAVFHKFYDDFFNKTSPLANGVKANAGYPKMNYHTDNKKTYMVFAVPGVKKEDLQVEFNDDNTVLTVSGKMSSEYISGDSNIYWLREVRQSSFSRSVKCPRSDKPPNATLKDGLLFLEWENEEYKPKEKKLIEIR
jgi:HSP20 family molecular chaperone IbpA